MDGQHVTLESVNSFLVDKVASANSTWATIKLTVQRPSIDDVPRNSQDSLSQRVGELNLDSNASSRPSSATTDSAHMFLYLTKEGVTESSPERADVVFQHPPPSSTSRTQGLFKSRGVFVTLCQLLSDISVSKPLVTSVMLDSDLVHVAYIEESPDDLLLLALPASSGLANNFFFCLQKSLSIFPLIRDDIVLFCSF